MWKKVWGGGRGDDGGPSEVWGKCGEERHAHTPIDLEPKLPLRLRLYPKPSLPPPPQEL